MVTGTQVWDRRQQWKSGFERRSDEPDRNPRPYVVREGIKLEKRSGRSVVLM